MLERAAGVFGAEQVAADEPKTDLKALHAKISPQALHFVRRARQGRPAERRAMINPDHTVSVKRQAQLIDISHGTAYYVSRTTTSDADQALMKEIDRLHLEYPFAGAWMLRDLLLREGVNVGRRHVGTLMAKMEPVRNFVCEA